MKWCEWQEKKVGFIPSNLGPVPHRRMRVLAAVKHFLVVALKDDLSVRVCNWANYCVEGTRVCLIYQASFVDDGVSQFFSQEAADFDNLL